MLLKPALVGVKRDVSRPSGLKYRGHSVGIRDLAEKAKQDGATAWVLLFAESSEQRLEGERERGREREKERERERERERETHHPRP